MAMKPVTQGFHVVNLSGNPPLGSDEKIFDKTGQLKDIERVDSPAPVKAEGANCFLGLAY